MHNSDFELNDVEALLRSASEYVRPSDDLRPSVLEEARVARAEWRVQGWIWYVGLGIALSVVLISHWRLEPMREFESTAPSSAVSQQPENPGWHAVDHFNSIRRRQAAVLRSAL